MSQYDFRAAATQLTAATASLVHPATPACVAISPIAGEHQLVTGAYDGVVRLWDLRSTKSAVTSFRAWEGTPKKGGKVLAVDWARGVVAVGGVPRHHYVRGVLSFDRAPGDLTGLRPLMNDEFYARVDEVLLRAGEMFQSAQLSIDPPKLRALRPGNR